MSAQMVRHLALRATLLAVLAVSIGGCTALEQLAALQRVAFALDRTADTQIGGVPLTSLQNYNDLNAVQLLQLGTAVTRGELPLNFTLFVDATNPSENATAARLVNFDWTLFLDGSETVSGTYNNETLLPPGQTVGIPLDIRLDLIQFFGNNLPDLVELALAVSDLGGSGKEIRLQATPSINTALGPIRYPGALTIVKADVGS
ncbi:MAG: hypothetical protein AAGG50_19885 [Bacteroidota bacterium]